MAADDKNAVVSRLHPRNKNRDRYDLTALIGELPALKPYVKPNKYGVESVDFADPMAVKLLNKAILSYYYGIKHWDFPAPHLCPPIPGRADYVHYMADVLLESNFGKLPVGDKITCLDIGVGASCIYPIIGIVEYNWNFIGSDIDLASIDAAEDIVVANPILREKVDCHIQTNPKDYFYGVLRKTNTIDLSICNPPFHASAADAAKGTKRKLSNLGHSKRRATTLNFAGVQNELICDGGERQFINNMIKESSRFAKNCYWFSSIVSKQSNLKGIYQTLHNVKATQVKTIPMGTGNKSTRIVAWSFLEKQEAIEWRKARW